MYHTFRSFLASLLLLGALVFHLGVRGVFLCSCVNQFFILVGSVDLVPAYVNVWCEL